MRDFSVCKNEQQFKMMFIKEVLSKSYDVVFPIETEETVAGFPDVMAIKDEKVTLFEFKYTKTNKIKFQPTQPAFYRKYKGKLNIIIIAYSLKKNAVDTIPSDFLFTEGNPYKMNEKAEVTL